MHYLCQLSVLPARCLALIQWVLAAEDVIARLIPPQLAASSAQSQDQSADHDQSSGPAHPALWAPLAQQRQPSTCPTPLPTCPTLPAPRHRDSSVQAPSVPCFTISSNVDDVGQLQAAALLGCSRPPPRFQAIDGSLHASRHSSALGSIKQLALRSAATDAQPPFAISAVGLHRQSMPTLQGNIVPLRGLVQGHNGSKRLYNSLSESSRRAASVQLDNRQAACRVCDITVHETESNSRTDDLHSVFQQHRRQHRQRQQQQQQQQQQPALTAPMTGIWTQTSRLARFVSFPVRVTRAYYSYVPLGQQLYLNPQSVTTSIQDPDQSLGSCVASDECSASAAAAAATVLAPATSPAAMHPASDEQFATSSISEAVTEVVDSVVLQRREQLGRLWMHRMPTYRARFQQIFFGAVGQALPMPLPALAYQASQFEAESGRQGRPIAPEIRVHRAEACAGNLLASHHLKDMLKVSFSLFCSDSCVMWITGSQLHKTCVAVVHTGGVCVIACRTSKL